MALGCYLAMTAAEFHAAQVLPEQVAWMACHFSCYGLGLSNLPNRLPEGAMIILNDRTPIAGHDPQLIAKQMAQLVEQQKTSCVLLDLQRPDVAEAFAVAKTLVDTLPCPVGISEAYARELSCPVFLPPPPLHVSLEDHLTPWAGREIWLEAALEAESIKVTEAGSEIAAVSVTDIPEPYFDEPKLYCRYHIDLIEDAAVFTLLRDKAQLKGLLVQAETLGVKLAVGLYQQLG